MRQIDKNSKLPLYYQLMQLIIDEIDNDMEVGEKLPSEREFCSKYGLSRSTVRQAFLELGQEGYIYKVHGRGTFVSPKKLQQELLKFYSFTTEMKKMGKRPSSKVINFACIACDRSLARKMKKEEGCEVYRFLRLRLADDRPVMLETSYVPKARFEGLSKEGLEQNAMYDLFTHIYGVNFTYAEERFQAVPTDEMTAGYLKVERTLPSLKIERFTYERDQIIEYTVSMARGDQLIYSVKLNQ